MGGLGSGQWYRWDKKDTTAQCRALSINDLMRGKLLSPGWRGGGYFVWHEGQSSESSISYLLTMGQHGGTLQLRYTLTANGQHLDYPVAIEATTPHFGGRRYWFKCPGCQRRIGKLFLKQGIFACRHCHNLTYSSSQHSDKHIGMARRRIKALLEREFPGMKITRELWNDILLDVAINGQVPMITALKLIR